MRLVEKVNKKQLGFTVRRINHFTAAWGQVMSSNITMKVMFGLDKTYATMANYWKLVR